MTNIFYCTICQFAEESLPNAYRVRPYVNEIIIVYNQPIIDQVRAELEELGATLHHVDWKEDFSFKRTQYIRKSGEIIEEKGNTCGYTKNNTWMLVTDTDEFLSIETLKNLKSLITEVEADRYTMCTINSHDILIKGEGKLNPFTFIPRPIEEISEEEIISHNVSDYFKELLVKYQDELEYRGKVHHTLSGPGLRLIRASKDYWYGHIKTDADLHSHGCRNWFIGGGGVQEFGKKWKVLRSITNKYGIDSWEKMEKAMKIGNIHSDILQFIVDHKDDNDTPQDSELRSFCSYYKILHKDELENIVQTVKTVVTKDGIQSPIAKSEKTYESKDEPLIFDPTWKEEYGPFYCQAEYNKKVDSSSNLDNNKLCKSKDEIREFVEDKSEISETEDEIREFVEDTYNIILGRPGDPDGIKNYTKLIKEKELKKEDLPNIFKDSEEYEEKILED